MYVLPEYLIYIFRDLKDVRNLVTMMFRAVLVWILIIPRNTRKRKGRLARALTNVFDLL